MSSIFIYLIDINVIREVDQIKISKKFDGDRMTKFYKLEGGDESGLGGVQIVEIIFVSPYIPRDIEYYTYEFLDHAGTNNYELTKFEGLDSPPIKQWCLIGQILHCRLKHQGKFFY